MIFFHSLTFTSQRDLTSWQSNLPHAKLVAMSNASTWTKKAASAKYNIEDLIQKGDVSKRKTYKQSRTVIHFPLRWAK